MFAHMSTASDTEPAALARTFHALADPKRLEIIALLMRGERCVCDLTDVVGAKQPLLSFHLKILRETRLVTNRRRGKWMYYSLNYETIDEMKEMIGSLADRREHNDECCCESLCCPSQYARVNELRKSDETR